MEECRAQPSLNRWIGLFLLEGLVLAMASSVATRAQCNQVDFGIGSTLTAKCLVMDL
jgi:hypothetical protein